MVVWNAGGSLRVLRTMYWVHTPKTATEFTRTLLSLACGVGAFNFATVDTSNPARIDGDCHGKRSELQAGREHGWMHMPIPPTLHTELHTVVMSFRSPAQRILSAANHVEKCVGAHGVVACNCCWFGGGIVSHGASWGWTQEDRMSTFNATLTRGTQGFLSTLNGVGALSGCMTKMLLGIGCQERHALTIAEVERAKRYVMKLGFVMISGQPGHAYERSVCLLHSRFGGTVYNFEVSSYSDKDRRHHNESILRGYPDYEDTVIYSAAVARFEFEWAANPQANRCMQAVRTYSTHHSK